MIVRCIKIISPTTGEDLGGSSPWIIRGKAYVVLAIKHNLHAKTMEILLQSEDYKEPTFFEFNFDWFELLSDKISSYWVFGQDEDGCVCFMPPDWFQEGFGEDMDNGDESSMMIYRRDRDLMFSEDPIRSELG